MKANYSHTLFTMADPYSHLFSSPPPFFQFNPFPSSNPSSHHPSSSSSSYFINPTTASSSTFFHYHHHHHHHQATSYSSIPSSSPPSPPLREALPLLSLSPSKQEARDHHHDHQDLDAKDRMILHSAKPKEEEDDEDDEEEANTVTVALRIGLPSPSAAEMASVLSSSNYKGQQVGDGGGDDDDCSGPGFMLPNKLNKGQYWIPTPSQILIGPTQFSCPVCFKTFNRYNNMQVPSSFAPSLSSLSSPTFPPIPAKS